MTRYPKTKLVQLLFSSKSFTTFVLKTLLTTLLCDLFHLYQFFLNDGKTYSKLSCHKINH